MDKYYTTFKTGIGICALSWNAEGITTFALPDESVAALKDKTVQAAGEKTAWVKASEVADKFPQIDRAIKAITGHLEGHLSLLHEVQLDFNGLPPFFKKVYQELRKKVGPGKTVTYGELALLCGNPHGARAVGQAMRRNPFPLLIPCHRVVSPKNEMRGFSAPGGISTKIKLLKMEGAIPA